MGQIQVMSPALANQIAAGEVVERPASCVKELLENSLDAGASKVSIRLEEGGISAIAVDDNGSGMDKDDAILAFARHATSKLTNEYDLTRIETLGFRGEALASIAAVSRVTLQTRSGQEEHGWVLKAEGTDLTAEPEPVGMPQGTKIEVRDLFFNTPARLKYLRTVHTEQARCVEVVQRAALSRPDVAFRLAVDDKILFQTPGKNRVLDVLAILFGVGEAKQFLKVDLETPDYRVYGYIGRPTQGRSSRAHANWFLNNRSIRNIGLHQAVVKGYQGRLMINKQPVYALYLNMNATLVDVNIHPHKSEVRFSEERDVTRLVQEAVSKALEDAFLVPGATRTQEHWQQGISSSKQQELSLAKGTPTVHHGSISQPRFGSASAEEVAAAKELYRSSPYSHEAQRHVSNHVVASADEAQSASLQARARESKPVVDSANKGPEQRVTESKETSSQLEQAQSGPDVAADPAQAVREQLRGLRPIGQTLGTYILAEADDTLFVIDQHAAHERVLYERFRQQTEERETGSIPLLTPITMTLTPQQFSVCQTQVDVLQSLGIGVEQFGGYEIIVRTIPQIWEGLEVSMLLEELLQQVTELGRHQDPREALREKVVMRACKSAIKANHRLSDIEIAALCEALPDLQDPFHCPHGRPVLIRLSNADLEREFRRIV